MDALVRGVEQRGHHAVHAGRPSHRTGVTVDEHAHTLGGGYDENLTTSTGAAATRRRPAGRRRAGARRQRSPGRRTRRPTGGRPARRSQFVYVKATEGTTYV